MDGQPGIGGLWWHVLPLHAASRRCHRCSRCILRGTLYFRDIALGVGPLTLCCAQAGFVRGVASGATLRGEWWEGGFADTSLNRGNFTLTMTSGSAFTGTWGYGPSLDNGGTWDESRLSTSRPTDVQCFLSTASPTGMLCVAGACPCV